jgi:hypothetical protein
MNTAEFVLALFGPEQLYRTRECLWNRWFRDIDLSVYQDVLQTDRGCAWFAYLMLVEYAAEDPERLHWMAVDQALQGDDAAADNKARDLLAREFCKACRAFVELLITEPPSKMSTLIPNSPLIPNWLDWEDWSGVEGNPFDAAFEQILSDHDQFQAEEFRSNICPHWVSDTAEERWKFWLDIKNPAGNRWSEVLAAVLWNAKVKAEYEIDSRKPRPYQITTVRESGGEYVKMPKSVHGINWALGGAGVIDGGYVAAPNVVRYVSRSAGLLPAGRRPHQQQLDIEIGANDTFVLSAVCDAQYLLTPNSAKLLLFFMVTAKPNDLVEGTLGELAQALNPSKRRIQARDRAVVSRAAHALDTIRVVFNDNTGTRLFIIGSPYDTEDTSADQTVSWRYNPIFTRAAEAHGLGVFKGEFVLNFDGALELTGNESALLRHYIFAAGSWNDAKRPNTNQFDAKYLPAYTIKEWAMRTNTLSLQAAQYLEEEDRGTRKKLRRKLSRDKLKTKENLEKLQDNHGLIKIEKSGRDKLKVLPPDECLDAFAAFRRGGGRPSDKWSS